MRILEVRDLGCEYTDRYTVVLDQIDAYIPDYVYYSIAMGDNDWRSHCSASLGEHLGELINFDDLPKPCQANVIEEFEDNYIDEIDTGFEDEENEPEMFYQQRVNEQLLHAFKASGREPAPYNEDDDQQGEIA